MYDFSSFYSEKAEQSQWNFKPNAGMHSQSFANASMARDMFQARQEIAWHRDNPEQLEISASKEKVLLPL